MRKQTKLVAVLSTAALLAVGASMTSFAAQGWAEENGTWVYYNKSGELETEKWEKSGDNWFYLNEDGEMATDVVVEYNDNYYYVDENGAMATNKWVSVENEDYDGDDDEEPLNNWYYFGSNGKAYKSGTNSSTASFKTINGKKYIFDDEGKMLYGWINKEGERETGDDAWKDGIYYCGTQDDGAQAIGWAYLDIVDEDWENTVAEGYSSGNVFDDENQTRYFYFKSNGSKIKDKKNEAINGRKYSFDSYGRMNAEWIVYGATPTTSTTSTASQGKKDYTSKWRYYGSPEDGARVTKGWFKVVPDENLQEGKYNDDEDFDYFADKDGNLVTSKIETINGKKYLFDNYGRMKSGLKFVKFETGSTIKVMDGDKGILADDDDNLPFDTEENFKNNANDLLEAGYYAYYFGGGDDGSMKTSKQNISIDGESFNFLFNKSGSLKGAGKTGKDNDKYYLAGMLLAADKDDKYAVVKIEKDGLNLPDGKKLDKYTLLDTDEFLDEIYVKETAVYDKDKYTEHYTVSVPVGVDIEYKLVNTSGSVQKGKKKAKDGNDRCYEQTGETIKHVFVED